MQDLSPHLCNVLATLPKSPWVYQMKDSEGEVLYVWKANNLRSRVGSYFRNDAVLSPAKKRMVTQIADIEVLLCQTEVEALILETNLIKHLAPKYNILMKDDKDLAYIKVTNAPVPEVIQTRKRVNDGSRYYGPYTLGANVSGSLKLLRRIFRVRACRMKFAKKWDQVEIVDRAGRTPPCMDYYIGICPAPCLLTTDRMDEHAQSVTSMKLFLWGKQQTVIETLRSEMMRHAQRQEFEKAGKIKADIAALEMLHERQLARDALPGNQDVFVSLQKYGKYYIGLTKIRNGHIVWVFRHSIDTRWEESDAIVTQFLAREYLDQDDLPDTLILSQELSDASLMRWLEEHGVEIVVSDQGKRWAMLVFTKNQVREYAYKQQLHWWEGMILSRAHMKGVLEWLGLIPPKKWPIIFECYDISHTHGQFTYASRVVIENGKPNTSKYKKYKIRSINNGEIDDFLSHQEVMMRRAIEGKERENFPHLIIIDGGKGQLSHAIRGLSRGVQIYYERVNDLPWNEQYSKCAVNSIPICALAKKEEAVFVPGKKDTIRFRAGTPELMVLQKARDEAHRFSLTANRSARTKAMKKNILEELPGIGPVTRKKLLTLAGSLNHLMTLSEEELLTVVNHAQLETLKNHGLIR